MTLETHLNSDRRVAGIQLNGPEGGTSVKIPNMVNEDRHISFQGLVDVATSGPIGEVNGDREMTPILIVTVRRYHGWRLEENDGSALESVLQ